MAYKHYQLRETCPNPAGGPYRDISEPQMERNMDVVMEEIKNAFEKRIIPLLLENNMGNVHKVAACIATLSAFSLHEFMKTNRAEGQKPNLKIYDEMKVCLSAECDRQQYLAMAVALGIDPVMVAKGQAVIIPI